MLEGLSNMTNEELDVLKTALPVLIAAVTLIGGGIVYNWQKSIDRKNQIRSERRDLYRKFLVTARAIQTALLANSTEEEFVDLYSRLDRILAELLVCAPDDIINACEELGPSFVNAAQVKLGDKDGIFGDEYTKSSNVFDRVVLSMRKDVFGETNSTTQSIEKVLDGLDVFEGSISKSSRIADLMISWLRASF